jgi:hemolysin activation/secretion protein
LVPENAPVQAETNSFILKEVIVENSTVFTEKDFLPLIKPYLNQRVNLTDLENLKRELTNLYRQKDYFNSFIILPPQTFSDGKVTYQAREGELVSLKIKGLIHLKPSYIQARIKNALSTPVSRQKIESALILLQQDPLIETISANFNQRGNRNQAEITLTIQEAPRFQVAVRSDNEENPMIGSWGFSVLGSAQNLTGWGERLNFQYKITTETGLSQVDAFYFFPLTAHDQLNLEFRDNDTTILAEPFADLDLVNRSSTLGIGYQRSLLKTINNSFALGLKLDLVETEAFIFNDTPFPRFDGKNRLNLTVLRFSQIYTSNSTDSFFALSSQFNFGLNAFAASRASEFIDPDFFSWQGIAQYAQKLTDDLIFSVQIQGQLTPNSLPITEQFAIGGINTVRGYRRNIRIGDKGLIFSAELRQKIWQDLDWGIVQGYCFFDTGVIGNNKLPQIYPNTLASIGLGLNWEIQSTALLGINYGLKLVNDPSFGSGTLQDDGINLFFQLQTKF